MTSSLQPIRLSQHSIRVGMHDRSHPIHAISFEGLDIEGSMNIAGGAGEKFFDNAKTAVKVLTHMKNGSVSINDDNFAAGGTAKSPKDFAALTALLADHVDGTTAALNLKPPVASPFRWSVSKSSDGVRIDGHVNSEESRAKILNEVRSALGTDVVNDRQVLASGEPVNATAIRRVLLGFLKQLEAGQASMADTAVSIAGRVEDPALAAAIQEQFSDALPDGFSGSTNVLFPKTVEAPSTQEVAEAELPIADPYRWSVSKIPSGVTILGNVESQEIAGSVSEMVKRVLGVSEVSDKQIPAAGAPAGFAAVRQLLAEQVKLLEAGQGNIIGNQVSVTGRVVDEALRNQIDQTISSRLPAGFNGSTNIVFPVAPTTEEPGEGLPPIVSPYEWAIEKTTDGISVAGHIGNEESGNNLLGLVKSALNASQVYVDQEVVRGKPAGFDAARALVIRLMKFLEEGKGSLSDQTVSMTGNARNKNLLKLLERELNGKLPQGFTGSLDVVVPETKVVKAKDVEFVSQVVETCQDNIIAAVDGRKIQFETARAVIKAQSDSLIADVTKVALDCPNVRIQIIGHTDSRGRDTYNQELSEARAKAVAHRLVQSGVNADLLEVIGRGETEPLGDNETIQGRSQNRRIEFNVIQ